MSEKDNGDSEWVVAEVEEKKGVVYTIGERILGVDE